MNRPLRTDLTDRTLRSREETERNRTNMIESELSVALTLYDLAATEFRIGNDVHGRELLSKIRQAIHSARERMAESDAAPEHLREMRRQVEELENRSRELERQVP